MDPEWWGWRVARFATRLAVLGFVLVVAVSFLPWWPATLLEHFRVQLAIGGVLVVATAAGCARRGWLDGAAIALIVDACVVVPDLASSRAATAAGVACRVLLLNVHTSNSKFAAVARLIADENPDLIGLVEVDRRWLDALGPALAGYGSRIEHPRDDNFGVALYARRPLIGSVEPLGTAMPNVVAEVALEGGTLAVILTHPIPPITAALLDDQIEQFDAIAVRARGVVSPLVILGDFNATPWSRPFLRLKGRTGLCDTRAGFGLQASFPASPWLIRIPIDHALVSCAIGVRDRRIGDDVGSDHLPVIVDLVVPR